MLGKVWRLIWSIASRNVGWFPETVKQLVAEAKAKGKNNVAFISMFMLKDVDGCLDLLIETNRIPEAAFMARTYAPSRVSEIIALWKDDLRKVNKKAAEALADPTGHLFELFEGFDEALVSEERAAPKQTNSRMLAHTSALPQLKTSLKRLRKSLSRSKRLSKSQKP